MCRNVQVERPSVSTSGGQSGGGEGVVVVAGDVGEGFLAAAVGVSFLVMASQEATEVQERQL